MTKPRDWLAKVKRERHRYFTAWADTTGQADRAMNFAMTAWSLVQWVYLSNPELQVRYGDLCGFQKWVRQACPQMETMQTIGTVARHRQGLPTTQIRSPSLQAQPAPLRVTLPLFGRRDPRADRIEY
jgi:uncharacterized caspase-like protein